MSLSLFTIEYILGNKIKALLLANTYVIRYSFIFAKKVCQILEIELQHFIKLKHI